MALSYSDNIALTVPKNLDDSKGIYASSVWRPYNSTSEIFSTLSSSVLYESQLFPVKNGSNIELWQLVGGIAPANLTFIINAVYTNDVFDDGVSGTFVKVPIYNGVITGLINNWTGEIESYVQSTVKPNNGGTISSSDIIAGKGIYRKKDGVYYVKQFNGQIDARWFGLQNNTTGCEAPINNAIKAASGIEAELFIPGGIYTLSNSIALLNNTRIIGESNNGLADPSGTLTNGTVIKQPAATTFAPIHALAKSNIYLANLHFDSCYSFDLRGINNLTLSYLKVTNGTLHGIYAQGITNLLIDECYVNTTVSFGIAVEGSATGPCENISITNCYIENSGDNGIAVRAINDSVFKSNVSFNRIVNAGKAGIKNTIETGSLDSVQFIGATLVGNYIDGWGSAVTESAITVSCYRVTTSPLPQQYIENVVMEGNTMASSDLTVNTHQNNYIGMLRVKKASVIGNIGLNGCNTTGIFLYRSYDCIFTSNFIEKACQSISSTTDDGGLVIQDCNYTVAGNNTIKNTGISTAHRSGILIFGSKYGSYAGNLVYDDQSTPTQLYGIEERNDSSFLVSNNIFGLNLTSGNINAENLITVYSKAVNTQFIENTTITTTQTSSSLNTLYPSALPSTLISAPNVSSGMLYAKTSAGTWIAYSGTTI